MLPLLPCVGWQVHIPLLPLSVCAGVHACFCTVTWTGTCIACGECDRVFKMYPCLLIKLQNFLVVKYYGCWKFHFLQHVLLFFPDMGRLLLWSWLYLILQVVADGQSGMGKASYNMINSIIGAGIIGKCSRRNPVSTTNTTIDVEHTRKLAFFSKMCPRKAVPAGQRTQWSISLRDVIMVMGATTKVLVACAIMWIGCIQHATVQVI